jgi:hypothetical protein
VSLIGNCIAMTAGMPEAGVVPERDAELLRGDLHGAARPVGEQQHAAVLGGEPAVAM